MKNDQRRCRILKIRSPFNYLIQDLQNNQQDKQAIKGSITSRILNIQIQQKSNNQCFFHILPNLVSTINTKITYKLNQTNPKGKFRSKQELRKGQIYLNNQPITSFYKENQEISLSNEIQQYSTQQIIQCYVVKVQCLKLILLNLQNLKYITFYFSEFKLVRPNNIHPKQSWEIAQKYFIEELQGDFLQIKVNGTEKYREEMNVYGQILRIKNGDDIKEKIISNGYVQISKNANKYLSEETILKFTKMAEQAKNQYKGIWGLRQNKQAKKSTTQVQQVKFKKWESWINDKSYPKLKNFQEQTKQLFNEFKKLNSSTVDFYKAKILLGTIQLLFEKIEDKKILKILDQSIKILSQMFIQLQITIPNNISNMEFLKFYSKCLTFCIFYLQKNGQNIDPKQKQKFPSCSQMQKVLKTAFKTCYIGNQTFNERLFGKKKQTNFQNFSFDSAYLNGGISSYSEQSDYDESQQSKIESKGNKKIVTAHTKIRINSTYLISLIFKFYPSIVQNHWQICVRSNILSNDFFQHLKNQKINADSSNMSQSERIQLSLLFKNNFGDPSLLLLTIFQRNTKVRTNALNCIFNMITNFQGKKMINTTESFYIQKLLKSTKSSYIPKSYIIFTGLKNTLYFLLFTLKFEKNIEIIQITFKTLCELCNQCSLLDKLQFEDGMKLLMENYIQPVLSFPWNIPQLQELKAVCISFLSVLVSTQKKWDQIESNYLLSHQENNINFKLLDILKKRDQNKTQNDRIFQEIIKYFTKLAKQYFECIFFPLNKNQSIWDYLSAKSLQKTDPLFCNFITQIFKFNFDQIKMDEENNKSTKGDQRRSVKDVKIIKNKNSLILPFLEKFIRIYSNVVSNENYINLISIITNIDHNEWTQEGQGNQKSVQRGSILKITKQFILHIFSSFVGAHIEANKTKQINFPSIKNLQQNSLLRMNLIKMVGYMSFCEQFQKQQIIIPTIKVLLQHAKKYKTPNSVIKITWSLSNWVKVDIFPKYIKKQQLQDCINYLIQQSSSDKQKIASNSTRGIGFFLNQKGDIEQPQQLKAKCRKSIIDNLDHVIIKVRTNSTKALRTMITQLKKQQIAKITAILQQNILKNNYNLQEQTIMLIKDLGTPIENKRLLKLYITILKNLLNQSELQYEFSQIKTIKQLRKSVLEEAMSLINIVQQNDSIQIFITIYAYLVDCYSQQKEKNSKNKILQIGQERGEEVQKLIFNIKNKINYNEENVITTQTTLRGFEFTAKQSDLALIQKIKLCASNRSKYSLCSEWSQLQAIHIESDHVSVGNLYI